jgi:hypothetical protein
MPRQVSDAERYAWIRKFLVGQKWADTPLEHLRGPDEDKYITPDSLDSAIDRAVRYSKG